MSKRVLDPEADWQYLHVIFKAVGKGHGSDPYVFCKRKRKKFLDELVRYLKLYSPIEMLSFCVISNHAHCIFAIPKKVSISLSQVARQYEACYGTPMDARSHKCHRLRKDLNNISKFVQRFEHDFAVKFNKTSLFKRQGSLWVPRFHNTLLCNWKSLSKCWKYVEFNSVKAGLTPNPEAYEYGLWGAEEKLKTHCLKNFYKHYKRLAPSFNQNCISYDEFLELLTNKLIDEARKFKLLGFEKYQENNQLWHHRVVGTEEEVGRLFSSGKITARLSDIGITEGLCFI